MDLCKVVRYMAFAVSAISTVHWPPAGDTKVLGPMESRLGSSSSGLGLREDENDDELLPVEVVTFLEGF